MEDDTAVYENYLSGPRWWLPDGTIRKGIIDSGCKVHLEYERRVTSLLGATVFFKVYGPHREVVAFRKSLEQAIRNYNSP